MNSLNVFGQTLFSLRKSRRKATEELAQQLNLPAKQLHAIEAGHEVPTYKFITRVSTVLNLNYHETQLL